MIIGCPSKKGMLVKKYGKGRNFYIRIALNVVGSFESYYIQDKNECIPVFEMLGRGNLDSHQSLNSLYFNNVCQIILHFL